MFLNFEKVISLAQDLFKLQGRSRGIIEAILSQQCRRHAGHA